MSTQANGVNTAPNTVSSNNTLAALNTSESVTSAAPTAPVQGTRLVGKQYDKLYAKTDKAPAPATTLGEQASEKARGGDDIFSSITKVITCVATAIANPPGFIAGTFVDLLNSKDKNKA